MRWGGISRGTACCSSCGAGIGVGIEGGRSSSASPPVVVALAAEKGGHLEPPPAASDANDAASVAVAGAVKAEGVRRGEGEAQIPLLGNPADRKSPGLRGRGRGRGGRGGGRGRDGSSSDVLADGRYYESATTRRGGRGPRGRGRPRGSTRRFPDMSFRSGGVEPPELTLLRELAVRGARVPKSTITQAYFACCKAKLIEQSFWLLKQLKKEGVRLDSKHFGAAMYL
jgi:hypothetical protein